ncbi:MAG TPA: patatin-like phospholipase family protein [Hyphomonadaceae bacterium]|jgi:NTE family protein|nr:patatin-like phospholipase family protein [Hyphomonadaceae bacterium]
MSLAIKPSDVLYLALQGGGGKGFAYIGAVEALEQLGVLPVEKGAKGNLRGISGTSAGAIIGLLLAMGCTSKDLLEIFGSNDEFLKFFDAPESGFARAIRPNDWRARKSLRDAWVVRSVMNTKELTNRISTILNDINSAPASLFGLTAQSSVRLTGATLLAVWLSLLPPTRKALELASKYPFLAPLVRDTTAYATNLVYDRGLFPGFQVRDFLRRIISKYISVHPNWKRQLPDPADITFAEFKDITGYDFVTVGTNLSQRRSVYFSAALTPRFRVAEAVGISCCIPIMFKPVWIEADASDPVLGDLRGYWVDGGVLNNIPIHAFDGGASDMRPAKGALPLLNPNVLGLALRPGPPMSAVPSLPNDDEPFTSFAVDLLETTLSPSGPGQYATDRERAQVIEIFSFSLSLFDFAPSESAGRLPRRAAFDQVISHFANSR